MKQQILTITENVPVTAAVYRMTLTAPDLEQQKPGGFVNIRLDELFLRRPISVYDSEPGHLTILYKVVGKGTGQMAAMRPGETLDVLTDLGNGYDLSKAGETPLLMGGGVGVPPLYLLAKQLTAQGKKVRAVLGFNTADEVFGEEAFRSLGCEVTVTLQPSVLNAFSPKTSVAVLKPSIACTVFPPAVSCFASRYRGGTPTPPPSSSGVPPALDRS